MPRDAAFDIRITLRCDVLLTMGMLFLLSSGFLRQLAAQPTTDARTGAIQWEQAFEQVIEKSSPAIVSLQVVSARAGAEEGSRTPWSQTDLFGSGVLIRGEEDSRFVLTNAHLVQSLLVPSGKEGGRILAVWSDRQRVPVSLQAADPRSDLAILRLDLSGTKLKASELPGLNVGQAEGLKRGRMVVCLGNPYAIAWDGTCSASFGMVSNLFRRPFLGSSRRPLDDGSRLHQLGLLMQLDTRLQLGSSGGAVLNLDGEWIGLTTPLAVLPGTEKSAGYAIPFTKGVRRVIDSLVRGYEVEYGFLGIAPQDIPLAELGTVPEKITQPAAPYISHVAGGGPADLAGIKPGDVVLQVGETPVLSGDDLVREIGLLGPDVEVSLQVWRPRTGITECVAKLGKWPVYDDQQLKISADRYPAWRGIKVDYPTARRRYLPTDPLEKYPHAVVVLAAPEDSGLVAGDYLAQVEQQLVKTPREFHKAVENKLGDVKLIKRDGVTLTVRP